LSRPPTALANPVEVLDSREVEKDRV